MTHVRSLDTAGWLAGATFTVRGGALDPAGRHVGLMGGSWTGYDVYSTGGAMPGDEITSLAATPDGSPWMGTARLGAMV